MEATLDYVYRYPQLSVVSAQGEQRVGLATWSPAQPAPFLFRGRLLKPRRTADLLLALMRVVDARFYLPPATIAKIRRLADPVVTCAEERIRFEAFSQCCGAYCRVDLLPEAIDGALLAAGTTNVDFNPPMRTALAALHDSAPASLSVGADEVSLETSDRTITERKVALPVRWIKGFVEVQAHQARMEPRFEINGPEAARLLASLPRANSRTPTLWIVRSGSGIRVSTLASAGGIPVGGLERLHVLDPIVRHVTRLRIYTAPEAEASGWEFDFGWAKLFLVLSPAASRGFSGEGQTLERLAVDVDEATVLNVRSHLDWTPKLYIDDIASASGRSLPEVRASLARLAALGLVGYDLSAAAYFRRELPFDIDRIDELQPRLAGARELIANNMVRIVTLESAQTEAWVQGDGCEYRVTLRSDGHRCSCPWYAKHQGDRGPCKHVLAVELLTGGRDDA